MNRPSRSDQKAKFAAWKEWERAKARSEFPLANHLLKESFYQVERRIGSSYCLHNAVISEAVAAC